MIYCIILLYGSTKFVIMIDRQDTKQLTTIQTSYFPNDQVYYAEELGFDF